MGDEDLQASVDEGSISSATFDALNLGGPDFDFSLALSSQPSRQPAAPSPTLSPHRESTLKAWTNQSPSRVRGSCVWFDRRRGFGFVCVHETDSGESFDPATKDVFVHRNALRNCSELAPGQLVEFSTTTDEKGKLAAMDVFYIPQHRRSLPTSLHPTSNSSPLGFEHYPAHTGHRRRTPIVPVHSWDGIPAAMHQQHLSLPHGRSGSFPMQQRSTISSALRDYDSPSPPVMPVYSPQTTPLPQIAAVPSRDHNQEFAGKVVLVVGAIGVLGRCIARGFAMRGASIVVADIRNLAEAMDDFRAEFPASKFVGVQCDIRDESQVNHMISTAVSSLGRLDIAINVAGIEGPRSPIADLSLASFEQVMNGNCTSLFLCMKHQIKAMLAQSASNSSPSHLSPVDQHAFSIVNIASACGAEPEFGAYSASKHAVIALSKAAAKENAAYGIRINCVCPAAVGNGSDYAGWPEWASTSCPAGRMARPEEVAEAALFLASIRCRFMVGQCMTLDGGGVNC